MVSGDSIPTDSYRISDSAISGSRAACIHLDTSYYGFLKRYGMAVRSFLVTQPDGSTFVVQASPARINTANPHEAKPLLFLQPPLPAAEIPAGSCLSVNHDATNVA
jgi:hypothetical protein